MLRTVTGVVGVCLIGVGAFLLAGVRDPLGVLLWLGGALVLHDAVLAPLVLAAGMALAALPRRGGAARGVVRGVLVTGGALVVVTLPLLLRPGAPPNPSALPLPYGRNLLVVLAAVAAAGAGLAVVRAVRQRRRSSTNTRPPAVH
ncbi:hypothetical protein [Streptomyces ficellus]|uniref:Uncharacterized protein n=1 Tax=Streptomyces ficellus TaxID=1977088 RepID=A0A6I6F387_9ACTN|nr:hypothetical protein [Streptomyces ficellus]QGV77261.1 hypothetical protein EIZ62_02575 [Streptomyces ficellus]